MAWIGKKSGYVLAVVLAAIVVGSALAHSTTEAFAIGKKCPHKKYENKCDRAEPRVHILTPDNRDRVTNPIIVTGTATDSGSGIKKVEICAGPRCHFTLVSTTAGPWTTVVTMTPGTHEIVVKATDWVNNKDRDTIKVKVL